jgi:hypothetical protein
MKYKKVSRLRSKNSKLLHGTLLNPRDNKSMFSVCSSCRRLKRSVGAGKHLGNHSASFSMSSVRPFIVTGVKIVPPPGAQLPARATAADEIPQGNPGLAAGRRSMRVSFHQEDDAPGLSVDDMAPAMRPGLGLSLAVDDDTITSTSPRRGPGLGLSLAVEDDDGDIGGAVASWSSAKLKRSLSVVANYRRGMKSFVMTDFGELKLDNGMVLDAHGIHKSKTIFGTLERVLYFNSGYFHVKTINCLLQDLKLGLENMLRTQMISSHYEYWAEAPLVVSTWRCTLRLWPLLP